GSEPGRGVQGADGELQKWEPPNRQHDLQHFEWTPGQGAGDAAHTTQFNDPALELDHGAECRIAVRERGGMRRPREEMRAHRGWRAGPALLVPSGRDRALR